MTPEARAFFDRYRTELEAMPLAVRIEAAFNITKYALVSACEIKMGDRIGVSLSMLACICQEFALLVIELPEDLKSFHAERERGIKQHEH